jgi:magnesium chelatase family protein
MFCKLQSTGIVGVTCVPVTVEVDLHKGQTAFAIVGLADTSIKEAKDRVYSAIKNAGFTYPFNFRILVNLAPADTHKEGSAYDVPIALAIIALANAMTLECHKALFVGELGLDGAVRRVPGVLLSALYAKEHGFTELFVPEGDAPEAGLVLGLTIFPVRHLRQLVDHMAGKETIRPYTPALERHTRAPATGYDMAHIQGQAFAKRALEVSASGGHNCLLSGPPGSGKTLLARTLPSILPPLSDQELLEVVTVHSVAGLTPEVATYERPFRAPHHTASAVAVVGGGRSPRPGEISLAHRGVLFMDEFPEFARMVIESLRQPLEDGIVTVSRAERSITFPARFMLVASKNPCPCGFASDPEKQCICLPAQLAKYQKKMSGPLLDRIDLHIEVPRVPIDLLSSGAKAEASSIIRERVMLARERQQERFKEMAIETNSEMTSEQVRTFCPLEPKALECLRTATARFHLSPRAYYRIIKVARTLADMAGQDMIAFEHIAEALQFRLSETH